MSLDNIFKDADKHFLCTNCSNKDRGTVNQAYTIVNHGDPSCEVCKGKSIWGYCDSCEIGMHRRCNEWCVCSCKCNSDLTYYTFANNSLCPRCLKVTSDLVRYEGCDHCGCKTPQGAGIMSMRIPKSFITTIMERNPGIVFK